MKRKDRKKRITKMEKSRIRLLDSIARYIEIHGGKVLIIGGISIFSSKTLKYNHSISINFTGLPPIKSPKP